MGLAELLLAVEVALAARDAIGRALGELTLLACRHVDHEQLTPANEGHLAAVGADLGVDLRLVGTGELLQGAVRGAQVHVAPEGDEHHGGVLRPSVTGHAADPLALALAPQLFLTGHGLVRRRDVGRSKEDAVLTLGLVEREERHLVAARLALQVGHELAVRGQARLPRDLPAGGREGGDPLEGDGAGGRVADRVGRFGLSHRRCLDGDFGRRRRGTAREQRDQHRGRRAQHALRRRAPC